MKLCKKDKKYFFWKIDAKFELLRSFLPGTVALYGRIEKKKFWAQLKNEPKKGSR